MIFGLWAKTHKPKNESDAAVVQNECDYHPQIASDASVSVWQKVHKSAEKGWEKVLS